MRLRLGVVEVAIIAVCTLSMVPSARASKSGDSEVGGKMKTPRKHNNPSIRSIRTHSNGIVAPSQYEVSPWLQKKDELGKVGSIGQTSF